MTPLSPRLRPRDNGGNGHASVSPDILTPAPQVRSPWEIDVRKVAKVIGTIVTMAAFLVGLWYGLVGKVEAHDAEIRRLANDVQKIEAKAKTKEGAEGDMRVVAVELRAIGQRLDAIDKRVERVEMRQVGIPVAAPERE